MEGSSDHKEQEGLPSLGPLSTHKEALELTVLQYFEFGGWLPRLKMRWKGGEWPIAFDNVLRSS